MFSVTGTVMGLWPNVENDTVPVYVPPGRLVALLSWMDTFEVVTPLLGTTDNHDPPTGEFTVAVAV